MLPHGASRPSLSNVCAIVLAVTLAPDVGRAGATLTVTSTADSGAGSLRQAILDANANAGADVIVFAIPGTGVQTISPASAMPEITDPVTIDGTTQSGYAGAPLIELDGAGAGQGVAGLDISAGGTTLRGLAIGRFSLYGIRLSGGGANVVEACYIGVDPTGTLDRGDGLAGITITGGSSGNRVGGTTAAQRNVLAGSAVGVIVEGTGKSNVIEGNYIGTDASGTFSISSSLGISVDSADVTIGGSDPGAGNLVSGHSGDGIHFGGNNGRVEGNRIGTDGSGTVALPNTANGLSIAGGSGVRVTGNVISGNGGGGINLTGSNCAVTNNFIGTDASGHFPLGNGGPGIAIERDSNDNTIGDADPAVANVIAFNGGDGVILSTSPSSPPGRGNTIHRNAIYANRGLGIDLVGLDFAPGPAPNDPLDADDGPNGMQNYPLITAVTYGAGTTTVSGLLGSAPNATFDLDFYGNAACAFRPHDYLQGESYMGSTTVVTDGDGAAAFTVELPTAALPGTPVSATATGADGSTSEFSQRIVFAVSPASGLAAGGALLALSGTNFQPGLTVTVGGSFAGAVTVETAELASATSPALTPGTVADIVAINPDGTSGTLVEGWLADFLDVPEANPFHASVTRLVTNGISAGCGAGNFCVDATLTRAQVAVLLLKGRNGLCFVPPPATGTVFADVAPDDFAAAWIEALAAAGITGGCGGGDYCPGNPVSRAQMGVFLLKTEHGPGYTPPPCAGIFDDVPCPSLFADWIEELYAEGSTAGCSVDPALYCPSDPTTRGQAAALLSTTFRLE